MSEFADTLMKNEELLENTQSPLFDHNMLKRHLESLDPLIEAIRSFNRETGEAPTKDSVKKTLRCMWTPEPTVDKYIHDTIEMGGALFSPGIHLAVARVMLRNPETYAEKFQMTTPEGRDFLQNKTAVVLKEFLIKTCLPLQVDSTPAGQSAKRN